MLHRDEKKKLGCLRSIVNLIREMRLVDYSCRVSYSDLWSAASGPAQARSPGES